ncbi:MAG: protein kinase [Caldilineaceae bacterium]|nr:protein kinase [Caldilineaceae bacterium]MCB9137923.1 protein kinase [Caldilineaceae bacterium]
MQSICPVCHLQAPDGNLYCEKPECPAEVGLRLFRKGDLVGDVEIVKVISVLPSAVIYEATRQTEKIFFKVAHQGEPHRERLKREAAIFRKLLGSKHDLPYFPTLLPPYSFTKVSQSEASYGKIGYEGALYYYLVFAYAPSEALSTVLSRQPQFWINHVGWIMVSATTALAYLQQAGIFHYALNPDAILVRFDEEPPRTPRVLLADLGVAAGRQDWASAWNAGLIPPAYAAPELIDERHHAIKKDGQAVRMDPHTDVYGLGGILYEMLVGRPPAAERPHTTAALFDDILAGNLVDMSRREDVRHVAEIAVNATALKASQRIESASAMGGQLIKIFGEVPPEKKPRTFNLRTAGMVIGALLLVAMLLALALTLL